MKKIVSLILALALCLGAAMSLTSCGVEPAKDWENAQNAGKIVVGMTYFEPMNYEDGSKVFIGFDTEYARAVGYYLGVDVEFVEIAWGSKYLELEAGTIDCIWNGFTSNSSDDGIPRSEKVDFTTGYANNYQCVVVNPAKISLDGFTLASLNGKACAVEEGSAGADFAKDLTTADKIYTKDAQIDAFTELKSGAVDFIVVDVLLADRYCGKGDYASCAKAYEDSENIELYAIGCRKGSNLDEKINEATKYLMNDGVNGGLSTLEYLSAKYNVPLSDEILALKDAE